jgi:hypothetical protein
MRAICHPRSELRGGSCEAVLLESPKDPDSDEGVKDADADADASRSCSTVVDGTPDEFTEGRPGVVVRDAVVVGTGAAESLAAFTGPLASCRLASLGENQKVVDLE